jgi:hypothetical protein
MLNLFNHDLLYLSIVSSTIVILGFVFYKIILAYINKYYNIGVDPDSRTIFLSLKKNTGDMSNSNIVECNIEVTLPSEVIQEIRELYGEEFAVGEADFIMNSYIIPNLDSSTINELILEILNHF